MDSRNLVKSVKLPVPAVMVADGTGFWDCPRGTVIEVNRITAYFTFYYESDKLEGLIPNVNLDHQGVEGLPYTDKRIEKFARQLAIDIFGKDTISDAAWSEQGAQSHKTMDLEALTDLPLHEDSIDILISRGFEDL